MNKRKVIGTIIGVIVFGALVVGATFAWFSYGITFNNATYNFTSRNFSIVYNHGSDITGANIYGETPTINDFTGPTDGRVDITASTVANSLNGTMEIYLFINSSAPSQILTSGAVEYAIVEEGSNYTISTTPYKGNIQTGTLTYIENQGYKKELATNLIVTSTPRIYHVYIWIDGELIDETFPNETSFSGYIGATAVQVHQ